MKPRALIFVCGAMMIGAGAGVAAEWEEGIGFRKLSVAPGPTRDPGFTLMTNAMLGVSFTNHISEARIRERQNIMNGSGVALGDFNHDGRPDIFLANKEGPSGLFQNLGGWRFQDVTAAAGVACDGQSSSGAVFADINGDGWVDLLVTSFGGPNACFINLRNGSFSNITASAGLFFRENMTSMALADIDGDGDLDLYLDNFGMVSVLRDGVNLATRMVNGVPTPIGRYANRLRILNGKMTELGEPDYLLLNDGQGRFSPASWSETFRSHNGKPATPTLDFGLATQMRDLNGDGAPDIYVCNDFQTPDRIWLNDGAGKFRAAPPSITRTMSFAAMGVDFADIDRDGDMDFIVVEMLARDMSVRLRQDNGSSPYIRHPGKCDDVEETYRNTLFLNNGDGTYSEIARLAGVAASDWSWCPIFIDVDLDGYEDLLITNGNADDTNNLDRGDPSTAVKNRRNRPLRPLLTSNAAFRNNGDLTFTNFSWKWRFEATAISHGMALADFDGDGDLDVVVNCWNAPPLIYRNDSGAPRVCVRLKGRGSNTQGIGAMLNFKSANGFVQKQEILCGGRYMSGDDPERTFACVGGEPFSLSVRWRSGRVTEITNVQSNVIYEIEEPNTAPTAWPPEKTVEPMFFDVSEQLNHAHHEESFDDFERQPLLPHRLSQAGPPLVWNGHDKLIIGSGRGGRLAVSVRGQKAIGIGPKLAGDAVSLVAVPKTERVIVAISTIESSEPPQLIDLDLASGASHPTLIPLAMSPGPLALLDLDGDGDLDLFVGAQPPPGRFPEAGPSCLFENDNGELKFARELNYGIVNGVVTADFNGDGATDLAVACEWGPVKILFNEHGQLREAVIGPPGIWMSVAVGDFDGDGRIDLVAGNWGRNSPQEEAIARPLRLYYGDWLGRGAIDLLESRFNPALNAWAPERLMTRVGPALPFVEQRCPTHQAYSVSSVETVLANKPARFLEATSIESAVFLNRGDRFEARALPIQAQFTPVSGIAVADFNGDGKQDLFLSQNYFATRTDMNRFDAGFGLLLIGQGNGNFRALSAAEAGIRIAGEQRGCVAADFDEDGRVDLAVGQNGGTTKLFRNMKR